MCIRDSARAEPWRVHGRRRGAKDGPAAAVGDGAVLVPGDFAPVGAGGVRQAQGRDRRAPDEDQDQVEAEDREGVGEDMAVPIDAVRRDDRDPDASRGSVGAGGSGLYRDA